MNDAVDGFFAQKIIQKRAVGKIAYIELCLRMDRSTAGLHVEYR